MTRTPHPSELSDDEFHHRRLSDDYAGAPGCPPGEPPADYDRLAQMRERFSVKQAETDMYNAAPYVKQPQPFDWLNLVVLPIIGAALLFAAWRYGWLPFDVIKEIVTHD